MDEHSYPYSEALAQSNPAEAAGSLAVIAKSQAESLRAELREHPERLQDVRNEARGASRALQAALLSLSGLTFSNKAVVDAMNAINEISRIAFMKEIQ